MATRRWLRALNSDASAVHSLHLTIMTHGARSFALFPFLSGCGSVRPHTCWRVGYTSAPLPQRIFSFSLFFVSARLKEGGSGGWRHEKAASGRRREEDPKLPSMGRRMWSVYSFLQMGNVSTFFFFGLAGFVHTLGCCCCCCCCCYILCGLYLFDLCDGDVHASPTWMADCPAFCPFCFVSVLSSVRLALCLLALFSSSSRFSPSCSLHVLLSARPAFCSSCSLSAMRFVFQHCFHPPAVPLLSGHTGRGMKLRRRGTRSCKT